MATLTRLSVLGFVLLICCAAGASAARRGEAGERRASSARAWRASSSTQRHPAQPGASVCKQHDCEPAQQANSSSVLSKQRWSCDHCCCARRADLVYNIPVGALLESLPGAAYLLPRGRNTRIAISLTPVTFKVCDCTRHARVTRLGRSVPCQPLGRCTCRCGTRPARSSRSRRRRT